MAFSSDNITNKVKQNAESYAKGFNKGANLKKTANLLASNVKDGLSSAVGKFKRTTNSIISKLMDGIPDNLLAKKMTEAKLITKSGEQDWRVRLSLPADYQRMTGQDDLLAPLLDTAGLVFPTNPTVLVSHEANYNSLHPVHTNYPFWAYQNSAIGQITITANFPVQNSLEARYWVACIHYLRSVTKMNYGQGPNAGSPPPVVRFNGYGDYVFKNVPVIVTSFQFDMPQDVDYISCGFKEDAASNNPIHNSEQFQEASGKPESGPSSWAPSTSLLTVSVVPQYSRRDVSKFDMKSFVKGEYGSGDTGFI
jgi:hypothetical protein|tara:strand:- start:281 stop:1207 length:927 start_codon:yes stop_codon:yes gene_type:complete